MNYLQVTDENIAHILDQFELVILDFYADWCAPCKSFAPTFAKVSKNYPQVAFGKINTEKEHLLAEDFTIRTIPTIVVLKQKTIILEKSGAMFEHSLIDLVEAALKVDITKLESDDEL